MQAIRTIQSVENGTLSVALPPDFQHTHVEVIILPYDQPFLETQDESSLDWKKDFLSVSVWENDDLVKVDSWKIQGVLPGGASRPGG